MPNSTLKILAAIAAACVTNTVFGGVIIDHQLVFTENSSSSLSVTFDGSATGITVMNTTPDNWAVNTSSLSFAEGTSFLAEWGEPETAGSKNVIALFTGDTNNFSVSSETEGASTVTNGFTYVGLLTFISDGVPVDVTFNDNGDTTRGVPDTGTTASLFGLSLMGLAFLRRKFC
jgi:hypothetical protein